MHFTAAIVGGVVLCVCVIVCIFVYNNLCPLLKLHPHMHSASLLLSLPLINLVFCVSSSEMRCVCVCAFVQTHVCYLGSLSAVEERL